MAKNSNNINSKYIIINLTFKNVNFKLSYDKIKLILTEWLSESLFCNYNNKLNWNIGIYIPETFNLISDIGSESKLNLYDNLIVKVFIYLDNSYYPFIYHNLLYSIDIYENNIK